MPIPDLIEIVPLDKPVRAEITVPGSKSITNRALILAALADGETTLQGALWSEDGSILVTVHYDGTARVWDIEQSGAIALLGDSDPKIAGVAITRDHAAILTLAAWERDEQKVIRAWRLYPRAQDLIEQARSTAIRCLMPSQRKQYFLAPSPLRWCVTSTHCSNRRVGG